MQRNRLSNPVLGNLRRWIAVALFRLASLTLRGAISLQRRGMISSVGLGVVLSVVIMRSLERSAAILGIGHKPYGNPEFRHRSVGDGDSH
jgi:hypothetical protein